MINKNIKVLSLFDGISCAQVALKKLKYKPEYYASEIDMPAIMATQRNHPGTIQLGSITGINKKTGLPKLDLLIGGSPCQDLSIAKGSRKGLQGERSGLFYEYVRILKELRPKYFVLENVASMPAEARDEITKILGVEPIMINAALVSAQTRKRYFWSNIPGILQPLDRGIYLKDIMEPKADPMYFVTETTASKIRTQQATRNPSDKSRALTASMYKGSQANGMTCIRVGTIGNDGQGNRIYSPRGKSVTLSAFGGGRGAKTGLYQMKSGIRRLTPLECERLQGVPDGYTTGVSNTQRYQMLGNAFNVEVVKHILSFIK